MPPVRNNTRIQQKTRFPVKLYRKEAIWQRGERIINNWSAVLVLITATASKYQDRVKDHPRRVAPTMPGTDDTTQSGTPCSAGWLANKLLKGHPLQVTSEYYGKNECPVSRCPVGSYISCTYIAYLSRTKKREKRNTSISSRRAVATHSRCSFSFFFFIFLFSFFVPFFHLRKNVVTLTSRRGSCLSRTQRIKRS